VELDRDQVWVTGEAQQPATLPQILSASPLFQGAALESATPIAGGAGESFRIHAARRKQ
jgi:hypothetical protein